MSMASSRELERSKELSVDALRSALQVEAEGHLQAAASLRVRMNTLIPVARLPPEILSHIFALYAAITQDYWTYSRRKVSQYDWIAITHVCHRWREDALGNPNLWSNIQTSFSSVKWVDEYLARSKQSALDVVISNTEKPGRWPLMMQKIAREASRLKTLLIYLNHRLFPSALTDSFPPSTPLLHSLTLRGAVNHTSRSGVNHPLPVPLTTWSMPSLQRLDIASLSVDWTGLTLPHSLVVLKVTSSRSSPPASVTSVVRVIGQLPELETLELHLVDFVWSPADDIAPLPFRLVYLPKLKSITLCAPTSQLACLLDHLLLPASTMVKLLINQSFNPSQMSRLAHSLTSRRSNALDEDTRQWIRKVRVMAFTLAITKKASAILAFEDPQIFLTLSRRAGGRDAVIRELLPHLPLHSVEELVLSDVPYASQDLYKALLAMPNVRNLTLECERPGLPVIQELLRMTLPDIGSAHGLQHKTQVLLPLLADLTLSEIRFRDLQDLRNHSRGISQSFQFVEELCQTIQDRKNHGSMLNKLTIQNCPNVHSDDVERLEKVVSVDWDHEAIWEESDSEDEDGSDSGY
ncbi:hypothetical protein EIP91_011551 [Steccherinum ochraceum]|uniref:F-box domain-containing protein n=1 Tax=Steccherinum ochraceum TaxID=92696 RepID=A0A4R0RVZ2_9APHY|nr:hypothetical protein EIP91_011551 [Steccherinum ochraceum]